MSAASTSSRGDSPRVLPVTVVVPTVARPFWLANCLRSIETLSPRPSSVLVVGRRDDTPSQNVAAEFGDRVRWAEVARVGHVDPVRVAVTACSTPFLAFIDDDAEPLRTDWLARLYEPFEDSNVGLVGSRVLEPDAAPKRVRRSAGRVTWFGRAVGNTAGRDDPAPVAVDMVPEGNCMWRTDAIRGVVIDRLWDKDDAALYGLDLALQAKRRGWRVMFTHAPRRSSTTSHRGSMALDRGRDRPQSRGLGAKHDVHRATPLPLATGAISHMVDARRRSNFHRVGIGRPAWNRRKACVLCGVARPSAGCTRVCG